jgi:hypothetical protein
MANMPYCFAVYLQVSNRSAIADVIRKLSSFFLELREPGLRGRFNLQVNPKLNQKTTASHPYYLLVDPLRRDKTSF